MPAHATHARRDTDLYDRWVRRVHDTRSGADIDGIAGAAGHHLVSWHVTDDPSRLVRFLRRGGNVRVAFGPKGQHAELGPGLYVGNPAVWGARSRGKWEFLQRLTGGEWRRLLAALDDVVREQRKDGFITEREAERALRTIDFARSSVYGPDALVGDLANQPYNIAFWRPEFLKPLGIAAGRRAGIVEVRFRGLYAELQGSRPPPALLRLLRRGGLQGAFTRAGMATNAELVIWDPQAIARAAIVEEP